MENTGLSEFELAVRRLYDTPDGKYVIDHLKKIKTERCFFPEQLGDGQATSMVIAFQEGEKNLALTLYNITQKKTGDER